MRHGTIIFAFVFFSAFLIENSIIKCYNVENQVSDARSTDQPYQFSDSSCKKSIDTILIDIFNDSRKITFILFVLIFRDLCVVRLCDWRRSFYYTRLAI